MAITYRTSATGGATSGTTNRTVTITPAVGDLFVVFACLSANAGTAVTMTDNNGGVYEKIGTALWSTSANCLVAFVRASLLTNTTSTIITCNSGSNTAGELVVVACAGSNFAGLSAIRQSAKQENQASGTAAPAFSSSALTGNMTLAALGSGDTTTTAPTNWTERQDANQSTPTTALEVATRDSGFTGTTVTFGASTSTVFASYIVELDGSAGAARSGTLAQTLGGITIVPGTGLAIGAAAVKQRINALNPATGTLETYSTNVTVTAVTNATDTFTSLAHGMTVGDGPFYWSTTGGFPTGLDGVTPDYMIVPLTTTFKAATSAANAVAGTAVNITSDGTGTLTLVRAVNSTASGSAFLVGCARGVDSTAPTAPFDNKSNDFGDFSETVTYAQFANSKVRIKIDLSGAGGAAHAFKADWGDLGGSGDEVTVWGFEVQGAAVLGPHASGEVAIGQDTITTGSITPTANAIVVVGLLGNGPVGQDHTWTPADTENWHKIVGCSAEGNISNNGYIQTTWFWIEATAGVPIAGTFAGVNQEGAMWFIYSFQAVPGALGAAADTLGTLTEAGAGNVTWLGQAAITLGTLTDSAAGKVAVAGAAAPTLGALTVGGAGTVSSGVSGAADITLGALASAGVGNVPVVGAAASTLGALTESGAGTVPITGAAAPTLGALAAAGAGNVPVVGSATPALGTLAAAGAGNVPVTGTGLEPLGGLAVTAAGNVPVTGSASPALGGLTTSGTGNVPVVGAGAADLGGLTVGAAGNVPVVGTGLEPLGGLTAVGEGSVPVTGAGGASFDPVTLAAVGGAGGLGALDSTLGAVGATATGVVPVTGTGSPATGSLTSEGAGVVPVGGVGAVVFGEVGGAAAGRVDVQGQAAPVLGGPTIAAAGEVPVTGFLASSLGGLALVASDRNVVIPLPANLSLVVIGASEFPLTSRGESAFTILPSPGSLPFALVEV